MGQVVGGFMILGQRGSNRRDTSNKGSQACAHMLHQVPNACHYPEEGLFFYTFFFLATHSIIQNPCYGTTSLLSRGLPR